MIAEPFVVYETWEGDGGAGAAFTLPDGMTVFVTNWDASSNSKMTEQQYKLACAIRDFVRNMNNDRIGRYEHECHAVVVEG